jgi:outer membrane protein assembly factor BamA
MPLLNLRDKQHLNTPWELADQITTIMQRDENEAQRKNAEVVITLGEPGRNSSDFSAIDSLISLGYRKTLEQMETIQRLATRPIARYTAPEQTDEVFPIRFLSLQNGAPSSNPPVQHFALADGVQKVAETWPHDTAPLLPQLVAPTSSNGHGNGLSLNAEAIQEWVEEIYATGQFAAVRAELRADSLRLVVQENPMLRQVHFTGNTIYPDSVLLACMQSRPGQAIVHQRSAEDLVAIVEHYRNGGYALAEIREVRFDSAAGLLQINLDEGHIGAIAIEGNRRTRDYVVLREFPQKAGDIFNSTLCSRGLSNIHSSGLFDQVTLNIRRGASGAIVKIKVQEKPFNVLRLGGRYDTERYTRGFIEIGDENAFGTGGKAFAYQEIGSRDLVTRLSLRNDRLFKTYLSFSDNLSYQAHENFVYQDLQDKPIGEYEEDRLGMHMAFGQQVRRVGAVSAELRLEEVNLKPITGTGYPTGNTTLNALILRTAVDTRDRLAISRRAVTSMPLRKRLC